jgi:hypothetical protein
VPCDASKDLPLFELARVVAGKIETQLIEGEFYPKAYTKTPKFNAPNAYKVIAVLDLDGDGKMEVVVASNFYEGEATTIYRCGPILHLKRTIESDHENLSTPCSIS